MDKREIKRLEEKRELIRLKRIFFKLLYQYYDKVGSWQRVADRLERKKQVVLNWKKERKINKTLLRKSLRILSQELNRTWLLSIIQKKIDREENEKSNIRKDTP